MVGEGVNAGVAVETVRSEGVVGVSPSSRALCGIREAEDVESL